jgi:hypothetical protein
VGGPAVRGVVAHPQLELAGVIVHDPSKEGRDAGELVGLPPLGVAATRDADAVLATRPDALFYGVNADLRPAESGAEVREVLRAGIDVVSAGMYALVHPPSAPAAVREPFERACREGGSSLLSSGIDPGFAIDLLPVVLSGVCNAFREVRVVENFDYTHYDQPEAVRSLIGMGGPMDAVPPMLHPAALEAVWAGSLRALAGALDLEVDGIRTHVERHALERDLDHPMGRFARGTQGAFRFEVQALVDGEPRLVVEHVTRIDPSTAPRWPRPVGQGCHQVRITGDPDLVLTLECEDARGNHAGGGNAAAAARLVHAIPHVCAAPPGLLGATDLPLLPGRGRRR